MSYRTRKITAFRASIWLLLLLIYTLTGCAYQAKKLNAVMESWLGKSESELILAWGPPQNTASDGNGGKVLVYSTTRQQTPQIKPALDVYGNMHQVVAPGATWEASRMFYVNSEGTIYAWRWQGL